MKIYGDFTTSLKRALSEIDKDWESYQGLVIAGTHNPKKDEVPMLLQEIKEARIKKMPTLLICYGHQLGAIEWARSVMDIKDATSEEFGKGTFVVKLRAEGLSVGLKNGESYWNNYEVREDVWQDWFLHRPESQFSTQFHPEYQSRIDEPHPYLVGFINFIKNYVEV